MTLWELHGWTILAALLASLSCASLGCFLVLRRMSLLGDAISHAILPGLAFAFLITESRDPLPMFIGAAICGLLTAFLSQFLAKYCNVDKGASLGVVFTTMFAIGVITLRVAADHVDLDPGCVLYGLLEFTPLDTMLLISYEIPRAVVILGAMFIVNVILISLFFKELTLVSFDSALATTLGISATLVHYLLMGAVAATSVAAFESVGSILVVAMFIVPGAVARLFSDRMKTTMIVSLFVGSLASVIGYIGAVWINTSIAGMISVTLGIFFLLAVILAPRYGLLSKGARLFWHRIRVFSEDILGLMYRVEKERHRSFPLSTNNISQALGGGIMPHLALFSLRISKAISPTDHRTFALTTTGQENAKRIIRSHRLWESYLVNFLNLNPDHVHDTAMALEHITTKEIETALTEEIPDTTKDPHGKDIP